MEKRESLKIIKKTNTNVNNMKDFSTFMGKNTINSKIGICKINCIHNEDYKEKLVRDILNYLKINVSQIELLKDELTNNNAYISYYDISEDEILMTPYKSVNVYEDMSFEFNRKDELQRFIDSYIDGVRAFNGISYTRVKEIKQNVINILLIDFLIDNFNRDFNSMQLAYNKKTGEYKILDWYGYSNAFDKDSTYRTGPFFKMTAVEVLEKLFENYYYELEPLYNKLISNLNNNKIRELFLQDYIIDNFDSEYIVLLQSNMQNNFELIKEKKDFAYKKIIKNKKSSPSEEKEKHFKYSTKKSKKLDKEKRGSILNSVLTILNRFKEMLQNSKVMRLNSASVQSENVYNYNFLNGDSIEVVVGGLESVENKKLRKIEVTRFYQSELNDNYTQDIEKYFYMDNYDFNKLDVETICNFFNEIYDNADISFFSGLRYIKSSMLEEYIYDLENKEADESEKLKVNKVVYITKNNVKKRKR